MAEHSITEPEFKAICSAFGRFIDSTRDNPQSLTDYQKEFLANTSWRIIGAEDRKDRDDEFGKRGLVLYYCYLFFRGRDIAAAIDQNNPNNRESIKTLKGHLDDGTICNPPHYRGHAMKIRDKMSNIGLWNPLDEILEDLMCSGERMQEVVDAIHTAGHDPDHRPVLILGESGTGKELVAKAIHLASPRAHWEMKTVVLATLTRELTGSTLFGHKKGSFTSAHEDRDGVLKEASDSSVFLDEIGEVDENAQIKLLRVIEYGEFLPVGSDRPEKTNTRFICATNRNLELEMLEGRFRNDLFQRIRAHTIRIPPLRDPGRKQAIPDLLLRLLGAFAPGPYALSPEVGEVLRNRHWNGNVRELKNLAQDIATVLAAQGRSTGTIGIADLPEEIRTEFETFYVSDSSRPRQTAPVGTAVSRTPLRVNIDLPIEVLTQESDHASAFAIIERDEAKRLFPDLRGLKDFFGRSVIDQALNVLQWNAECYRHYREQFLTGKAPRNVYRHILIVGGPGRGKYLLGRTFALLFSDAIRVPAAPTERYASMESGEILTETAGVFARFVHEGKQLDPARLSDLSMKLIEQGEAMVITNVDSLARTIGREALRLFLGNGTIPMCTPGNDAKYRPLPVIAIRETKGYKPENDEVIPEKAFHVVINLDTAYKLDGGLPPRGEPRESGLVWMLKYLLTDKTINPIVLDTADNGESVRRTVTRVAADAAEAISRLVYPDVLRDLALTLKASVKKAASGGSTTLTREHVVFTTSEPLDTRTGAFAIIRKGTRFLLVYNPAWEHLFWPGARYDPERDPSIRSTLIRGLRDKLITGVDGNIRCEPLRPIIEGTAHDALPTMEFSRSTKAYLSYRHFYFEVDPAQFSQATIRRITGGQQEAGFLYWVTEDDIRNGEYRGKNKVAIRISPALQRYYPSLAAALDD